VLFAIPDTAAHDALRLYALIIADQASRQCRAGWQCQKGRYVGGDLGLAGLVVRVDRFCHQVPARVRRCWDKPIRCIMYIMLNRVEMPRSGPPQAHPLLSPPISVSDPSASHPLSQARLRPPVP
jgi:hypothetical protein